MAPPAASWAGTVKEPADVVAPVRGSIWTTLDTVFCPGSRPPATTMPVPSEKATAREIGEPRCQTAEVATRWVVTGPPPDDRRVAECLSTETLPWPEDPGRIEKPTIAATTKARVTNVRRRRTARDARRRLGLVICGVMPSQGPDPASRDPKQCRRTRGGASGQALAKSTRNNDASASRKRPRRSCLVPGGEHGHLSGRLSTATRGEHGIYLHAAGRGSIFLPLRGHRNSHASWGRSRSDHLDHRAGAACGFWRARRAARST